MPSRIKSIAGHRRKWLTRGWELCSTAPGACDTPDSLASAAPSWIEFDAPTTAAAALRAANRWSLDGTPRRFDAEDWWFRTRFDAQPGTGQEQQILGFDGIATVADVWLNGHPLLASDSMFKAHELSVGHLLGKHNELVIRCRSLDRLMEARRPRPKWRTPMLENQQLRWFRTTLLGRTPGWSPPAAPVGPWRPVWLETRTQFSVSELRLNSGLRGLDGSLEASCTLTPVGAARIARVTLIATRNGNSHSVELKPAGDGYSGRLEIARVAAWWPFTHGEPALYQARLSVEIAGTAAAVDVDLGHVGFRTVSIDTDAQGFGVAVNGVPIFCRGACWMPLDPVSFSSPAAALDEAFAQLRAAGMNMLRVGGMTVYESDDFLDACDANGILLWQDFMFSNMNYPEEDAAFLACVQEESRQQLARLTGRPSLTVLCGNSEGEQQAAMWGAPRGEWSPRLFHEVLPALSQANCPDVPYWPSSTHGGAFPHQASAGTTSYYGVGAYLRPLEDARRSDVRFATECLAFANVPGDRALARIPGLATPRSHHPAWKARAPRDLGAGWDFDDVRDHYFEALLGIKPLQLRYADHDRYIAWSRAVSGHVMASVFAEWRRKRSSCRGGLVWFLRDLWCGAGWGVIDALGAPKAAYYFLSRVLQPRAVFLSDEGVNGLYVHVVNELASTAEVAVELALYRSGSSAGTKVNRPLSLGPRETLEIPAADWFEGFLDLSYAYRFGPAQQDLIVATLRDGNGQVLGQAFHFEFGAGLHNRSELGLSAEARARADGGFDVTVQTRSFAQGLWFEVEGYVPTDDHFHLAPGEQKTLILQPQVGEQQRGLRGKVHALNASTSIRITLVA